MTKLINTKDELNDFMYKIQEKIENDPRFSNTKQYLDSLEQDIENYKIINIERLQDNFMEYHLLYFDNTLCANCRVNFLYNDDGTKVCKCSFT
jgi:hypothetical protein